MVLIVTGASGVGKTSTLKTLSQNLPENLKIKFFHIDDIINPNWNEIADTQKFLEETMLELMETVVKTARKEKIPVIFEGSIDVKYYIKGLKKQNYADYKILLFDCSQETMKQRLINRGQPELYQQDMINWLNYLRKDALARGIKVINTDGATFEEVGIKIMNEFNTAP